MEAPCLLHRENMVMDMGLAMDMAMAMLMLMAMPIDTHQERVNL